MEQLVGARVLHVVRQFAPGVGGLEGFVRDLAWHQRESGIDACVVTLNRIFHRDQSRLPAMEVIDGIPVRRIGYVGSFKYPIAPGILVVTWSPSTSA